MRVKMLILLFLTSALLLSLAAGGERRTTLVTPPWNHCLGLHKVRQLHLDIFSGYREKFDDPQGLFCTKLHCEDDPDTEKDDDELTVFGLNSGRHKLIYNKSLTSIGIVGGQGSSLTRFDRPIAVTGDRAGNIIVADSGNNRLVHFMYENDELLPVKEISGNDDYRLRAPSGVALSGGLIYTADTGNDRIVVFRMDGTPVKSFTAARPGAGMFRPASIAAITKGDEWIYYGDYFIAVVDSFGNRLWKLSPEGRVLGLASYEEFGRSGRFNHVAIDYFGNIYATDAANGQIHKFTRHLEFLVSIGGGGDGRIRFDEPRGIAIYRQFGQIFVSERAGAQYFWIGTDLFRLSAEELTFDSVRNTCAVNVSFLLSEHSIVSIHLEDERGTKVLTILSEYMLPGGIFNKRIEVPCPEPEILANCKLHLVIVAKPTYSSRGFLTVTRKSPTIEATAAKTISSTAE
jgi:hypothetical protein